MSTIRVKRGNAVPTTSNMTYLGEIAFDYANNHLYARGESSVIKIGGEMEKVYDYQGATSYKNIIYDFDPNYIYKIHLIASTLTTGLDASDTYIYYKSSTQTNLYGSYLSHSVNTVNTTHTKYSATGQYRFYLKDSYISSPTITSGITKVIDFELTPTFKSSYNDVQQWVSYGKAITTLSGQKDAPIKMIDFVHSVYGNLKGINFYPGLNSGIPDSISVTIYRTRRI